MAKPPKKAKSLRNSASPLTRSVFNIRIGTEGDPDYRRIKVELEQYLWDSLDRLCEEEGKNRHEICTAIVRNYGGADEKYTSELIRYVCFMAGQARSGNAAAQAQKTGDEMREISGAAYTAFSPFMFALGQLKRIE